MRIDAGCKQKQSMYNVYLYDDHFNMREYVSRVLMMVCKLSESQASQVARLLDGVCQHELACTDGLDLALAWYESDETQRLLDTALPCGCTVARELVDPFVDLARALAAFDAGDCNSALGHALAASLARPSLAATAADVAARAEAELELIAREDADSAWPQGADDDDAEASSDVIADEDEAEGVKEPTGLPALAALHSLVGLRDVKERCTNLVEAVALERERGDDPKEKLFSLALTGNPGTGKSVFASLYAQLLGELRVLPQGRVVRVTGAELQDAGVEGLEKILDEFDKAGESRLEVGETVEVRRNGTWGHFGVIVHQDESPNARPPWKDSYDVHFGKMVRFKLSDGSVDVRRDHDFDIGVRRKDMRAREETGGVLIIDDAHQLDPANERAARQLLYRLADEMDQRGGRLAVVMAGYEKALLEQVLGFNFGALGNRFRRRFALPDFDDAELIELLQSQLATKKPSYHVVDDKYVRIAARRVGKGRGSLAFGNARAIVTLLDVASERQTARVVAERKAGLQPDIFEFQRNDLVGEPARLLDPANCAPLRELREMEGLSAVKSSVDGLLKLAESNAEREEQELPTAEVSLNRIFLGNPGTGKTTVARLYSRILRELGLLSIGDVVLATPSDLIGSALGQSEEKTNAILDKARGSVLVIDEAYGLDPASGGSFAGPNGAGGDPFKTAVIDTLVSRVTGEAGADQSVILLGYRKEMERFIRKGNPGLARRFQLENAFEFDDYDDQALLRILLRNVARRGKLVSFDTAKQVVRRDLAKARMRPNFGNAGAVDNAVSSAVVRAEARLEELPPSERVAQSTELLLADFLVEKPHVADPSIVFDGLIGLETIKTRLTEYQAVIEAAAKLGRDPIDDLALTFCFQGSPGTGKTTVARRMGMLFEALGVLPSADVVQVSASEFSTGFVGQTAAKTRDIFDSARGAVLFIDEAYRLYDPLGRSYMQEAVDEIVNLLTEEQYRGKMAVIFAGYDGQMTELLEKVNPGLKSRVADVIDFPDFDSHAAAEIAAQQLVRKRLALPAELGPRALEPFTRRLVAAPFWANGRDVETFVRRVAVECATRKTSAVPLDALDAALATVLQMKGESAPVIDRPPRPTGGSPFMTAEPVVQTTPSFDIDIQKAIQTAEMEGAGDNHDRDEDGPDFGEALEEAIVGLGYDESDSARSELETLLAAVVEEGAEFPEDVRSRVAGTTGATADAVNAALEQCARPALVAVRAAIAYRKERRVELDGIKDEGKRREEEEDEAFIMERLRTMGPCPQGFSWFRQGNGWRCAGGLHFVYDDDPILQRDRS